MLPCLQLSFRVFIHSFLGTNPSQLRGSEDGKSNQVAYGNNPKVRVKVWAADLAASPERLYLSFIPCGAALSSRAQLGPLSFLF